MGTYTGSKPFLVQRTILCAIGLLMSYLNHLSIGGEALVLPATVVIIAPQAECFYHKNDSPVNIADVPAGAELRVERVRDSRYFFTWKGRAAYVQKEHVTLLKEFEEQNNKRQGEARWVKSAKNGVIVWASSPSIVKKSEIPKRSVVSQAKVLSPEEHNRVVKEIRGSWRLVTPTGGDIQPTTNIGSFGVALVNLSEASSSNVDFLTVDINETELTCRMKMPRGYSSMIIVGTNAPMMMEKAPNGDMFGIIRFRYGLDTAAVPMATDLSLRDLEGKSYTFKGVFMLDRDKLNIHFQAPGFDRPISFKKDQGEYARDIILTLERDKK